MAMDWNALRMAQAQYVNNQGQPVGGMNATAINAPGGTVPLGVSRVRPNQPNQLPPAPPLRPNQNRPPAPVPPPPPPPPPVGTGGQQRRNRPMQPRPGTPEWRAAKQAERDQALAGWAQQQQVNQPNPTHFQRQRQQQRRIARQQQEAAWLAWRQAMPSGNDQAAWQEWRAQRPTPPGRWNRY